MASGDRCEIWEVIWSTDGTPVTGADVYVYDAGTTDEVTVYSAETGGGTLAQPVTTTSGVIPGWVPEGSYDLAYSYGAVTGTRRWNPVVGGNPLLAADSVGAAELEADSVGNSEIQDGSVRAQELAADSVGNDELQSDSVDSDNYVDGSIDLIHLAPDSVNGTKIADNSIDSEHYVDGSIDTAHIAADAIDGTLIADDAIGNEHLETGAVTYDNISLATPSSDASSAVAAGSFTNGAYVGTGASLSLDAGKWLVFVSGYLENAVASAGSVDFNASIVSGFAPVGAQRTTWYCELPTTYIPVHASWPLTLASTTTVQFMVRSNDLATQVTLALAANALNIAAIRVAG